MIMGFWTFFSTLTEPVVRWWKVWFEDAVPCPSCEMIVVPTEFGRTLEYECGCGWKQKVKLLDY